MRLTEALRLEPGWVAAFTGAGGKSALLGRLAAEADASVPVVLTTTTRLGREQDRLAALHLVLTSEAGAEALPHALAESPSVLVTGPLDEAGAKWRALSPQALARVSALTQRAGGVLAIEADGARGLPWKAPAEHEPVVPSFADLVVPVVGMDVIGAPLDPQHVHRPERVAALLGLGPGHTVAAEDLAAVLISSEGGLKGAPEGAEVRAFLNKAEGAARERGAREVASLVLEQARVRAVLAGAAAGDLPVREVYGRVAGVVLAAGGSSRLGKPKQLVPWRGRPLVWHAARAAVEGGLSPVVVVLGDAEAEVRAALEGEPVRFVPNPAWASGQSSSLRAGLEAARREIEAVVFLLADMPFVSGELVGALADVHRRTLAPIVAPQAGGRWANPVLFDRATFPALQALEGDVGGRPLFDRYPMTPLPWEDSILFDVDTQEDAARLWGQDPG